jgi:transposase-like protein
MPIGKGNKVHAKCPICSRKYTVTVERATLNQAWQVYYCTACKVKFRMPKGWRKKWLNERSIKST